jgi:hypothetical protein
MVSYSCSYIATEQFTGSPSLAKMPMTAIIVLTLTPWTAQPQLNNKLGIFVANVAIDKFSFN